MRLLMSFEATTLTTMDSYCFHAFPESALTKIERGREGASNRNNKLEAFLVVSVQAVFAKQETNCLLFRMKNVCTNVFSSFLSASS